MSHHNTILSQTLKLIPRHEFDSLSQQHNNQRRVGALSRWSQFVAMFTCQVSGLPSLRDIESTLRTQKQAFGLKKKLFSLDASLIDVSMKLFPAANYNRMKAAFKLHVGLDHDGLIPAFIAVTAGKVADQTQAKLFKFPRGSVVVFDKGYASYDWHASLAKQGVSYVKRMRDNAKFKVAAKHDVEKNSPILSDEMIEYTALRSSKKQLIPVRRMVIHDTESDKDFVFTTNRFDWSASLVAQLYKQRWQVELFFNARIICFSRYILRRCQVPVQMD